MKKTLSKTSSPKSLPPLEKGQLWQIGDVTVAVVQVGKLLVHYKRYKAVRPGTPTSMASIRELQEYLGGNKAVLVPR